MVMVLVMVLTLAVVDLLD